MLNAFHYKNKMNTVGYVVQLHNILFSTFTQKKILCSVQTISSGVVVFISRQNMLPLRVCSRNLP
jgi:hypothetical protein